MMGEKKFLTDLCSTCENIAFASDYEKALSSLVKNATRCLNAKASSVRLLDKSGGILEIAATYGLSTSYLKKGPVEKNKSPIDKLALRGKVIYPSDYMRLGVRHLPPLKQAKQLNRTTDGHVEHWSYYQKCS